MTTNPTGIRSVLYIHAIVLDKMSFSLAMQLLWATHSWFVSLIPVLSAKVFLLWPFYRPFDSLAPSMSYTVPVPHSLFSLDPSPQLSNAHTSLHPIGAISPGGGPENCPRLLQAGVPASRSQHLRGSGCLSAHCLRESCGEKSRIQIQVKVFVHLCQTKLTGHLP